MLYGAGSILGAQWIVTAKSVIMSLESKATVKKFVIYPKYEKNLKKMLAKKPKSYSSEKLFCSPKEDSDWSTSQSDLALVKISEAIPLNDKFQAIKIGHFTSRYTDIRVAGWGLSDKSDPSTSMNNLMYGDMSIFSTGCYPKCKVMTRYGGLWKNNVCHGDNGGPAVLKGDKKPDELVGIVTGFDSGCSWITEVMQKEPDKFRCEIHPE
ncbi:uncharacterized protein LOC141851635 [Brevipalpus obovatus]|uniref:uncharacterized protein LOC141851635 n=1 Tax=Brevipalpus obovatus TaxID=246614 RepID=UPI003D9F8B34